MTQAQQQNLQVALREPVGRVFLVLACAGSISAQELCAHLNVVCPGLFSDRTFEQALRSPFVEHLRDTRYGLRQEYRERVIQHYARNYQPEYWQTCLLLLQQQEVASRSFRAQLWWSEVREALYRSATEMARARRRLDELLRHAASPGDVNHVRSRMIEFGHILVPSPLVRPHVHVLERTERLVAQNRRNDSICTYGGVKYDINSDGDIVLTVDKTRQELFGALCAFVDQRSITPITKKATHDGDHVVTYRPVID